eukprot:TRINITY_DN102181_c0_g1_i1.p1 TRINITY_DN102181_c0_g1~~TRINITY_DN102181_c0_g1_i1.p1  ORF type:complete len:545 (-),score=168.09 TRINITY_DN102181_c0_g1_i1:258-1892(-)
MAGDAAVSAAAAEAREALEAGKKAHQGGRLPTAEECYVKALAALGVDLSTLSPTQKAPKMVTSSDVADALHLLGAARAQRYAAASSASRADDDDDEDGEQEEETPVDAARKAELEGAICLLRAALAAEPSEDPPARRARLRNSLGTALNEKRQPEAYEEAATVLRAASALDPSIWSVWNNLSKALRALCKAADKAGKAALEKTLSLERVAALIAMTKLRPSHPAANYRLGMELKRLGRDDEAAEALQANLQAAEAAGVSSVLSKDEWKIATSRHWLAALSGQVTATAPPTYVASLFDFYADTFDSHLVGKLHYQTPQLISSELQKLVDTDGRKSFGRCTDLGCGTGLMGPLLRKFHMTSLEGVDLSEGMLKKARDKGHRGVGYDRLICGDLLAAFKPLASLEAEPAQASRPPAIEHVPVSEELEVPAPARAADCFGLIVAADVFVYVGDLAPSLKASARWLAPDGLVVFSTEAMSDDSAAAGGTSTCGYSLSKNTGRYSHSPEYVERTAEDFGLSCLVRRAVTLRYNEGKPVCGHIYLFRLRDS